MKREIEKRRQTLNEGQKRESQSQTEGREERESKTDDGMKR